jgi:hypothetical protein
MGLTTYFPPSFAPAHSAFGFLQTWLPIHHPPHLLIMSVTRVFLCLCGWPVGAPLDCLILPGGGFLHPFVHDQLFIPFISKAI